MKFRHNKKRNSAFIYEALIREATVATMKNDTQRKEAAVRLLKKHFKSGTLLRKDLECYRSLYENQNLDRLTCEKILKEVKIQKRLIDNSRVDFIVSERDDSILLCEHFNQNSQFEYLRNKIIEIINSCENIKYSDIAVLSPQTNLIKPYLRYIFNNELINGEKIPYFFIDEDNHDSSGIYEFLIDITEIASEKITLEKIDYILSKKVTQKIFDFNITEKDEIIFLLTQAGFHWGLDDKERLGEEKNTLDWCINRIILGLIYDKEVNLSTFNLKPFSYKNISLDLNKWVKILIHLKKYINLIRGSFSYSNWVEKIKFILKSIADSNANFNLEISEINRILDNHATPLIPDDLILLKVFREILISCINKVKYQSKSRVNKILVSDIENSRHIPHKTY